MAVGTISEARRRANQANALKSTGPISDEGKAISAGNARTHGLAGQGTVLEPHDAVEMEDRLDAWKSQFNHLGPVASWLLRDIVSASVQIDSLQRVAAAKERRDRREAKESWDARQRIEAEELGSRLASDPSLTVLLLERTPHGCDWLINRWRLALDQYHPHSIDADRRLRPILDLIGFPADFAAPRKLDPQALLAQRTGKASPVTTWEHVGREEIRRLIALREQLAAGQDADRKRDAERGEILADDANSRLIKRYESRALRRFDRRFAQLKEILGGREGAGALDAEITGSSGAAVALEE